MLRKYVFKENRLKGKDQIGKGRRRRKLDLFGLISSPWPPPSREKSNPCLKINSQSKKTITLTTYNLHHHHYHLIRNGIWCALDQLPQTQKQPHFMLTSTTTHTITTHHRFLQRCLLIMIILFPRSSYSFYLVFKSSGSKESKTTIFSTGESIILNVYPIWRRSGENTL